MIYHYKINLCDQESNWGILDPEAAKLSITKVLQYHQPMATGIDVLAGGLNP